MPRLVMGHGPAAGAKAAARVWWQWPDVLALAGDSADNIPGVRGIGMTMAPKLIAQAGGLDNLLANPEQVCLLRCPVRCTL